MKFTFFPDVPDTHRNSFLIQLIEKEGFVPLVDAKHGNDLQWLQNNFKCPHRFYCIDAHGYMETFVADNLPKPPQWVVYFDIDQVVTDFEWEQIHLYTVNLLHGNGIMERTKRCIQRLKDIVATPDVLYQPEHPNLPQYYEFNSKLLEDQDIAVFEITKANGTTPYTTIVRNFSIKGYKPLFTNYFACNAFKNDFIAIQFLMKLWQEFMNGPMDLDDMLKEATQACYPGEDYIPIAEPEVYTKSLMHVVQQLQ